MINITFPVPIALNAQYRMRLAGKIPIKYTTMEAKRWMKRAHKLIVEHEMEPIEGNIRVGLKWYRKRRSGDIDGRFKLLLDVLQTGHKKWMSCGCEGKYGAYKDDAQINELHIQRFEDKVQPRMEVTIAPNP